jgi:hypothetical protein
VLSHVNLLVVGAVRRSAVLHSPPDAATPSRWIVAEWPSPVHRYRWVPAAGADARFGSFSNGPSRIREQAFEVESVELKQNKNAGTSAMRISERFGLGATQYELDFVDIDTDRDIPLFLDPVYLGNRRDAWSLDASRTLHNFSDLCIDRRPPAFSSGLIWSLALL